MLNFKLFLKENPDELSIYDPTTNSRKPIYWRTGQTFSLFDGYCLYSVEGQAVLHEIIARRISECYLAIEAALRNEITPEEVNECLLSPANGVAFLESKGKIDSKILKLLLETSNLMKAKRQTEGESNKKPAFVSYRSLSLKNLPEVIIGRIWKQNKVISFWNNPKNVFDSTSNIFNFVSNFGSPIEYHYEIENKLLDYGDFSKRNLDKPKEVKPDFDPSVMHTMPPSETKKQLQQMMGFKYMKPSNLTTWQKAFTSESTKC